MPTGILAGVRVLDFTWVLAGPYATRILADFGAEVIKVQSARIARGAEDNQTGYFQTWNRNKKSITLNLDHPAGRGLALALAAVSDIVVENFSPRVMSNWTLTYQDIQAVKPDLIMLSMSAAGRTGPGKDWLGFGPTLHALSGFTYLTSFSEQDPLGLGVPYGDVISGLYGALATVAALEYRARTGQGQHIDLSEYEALCTLLGPSLADSSVTRQPGRPQGNGPGEVPAGPHGCYPCRGKDRWCVIAVFNEEEWAALCRVMGDPAWTEGFSTLAKRKEQATELDSRIGEWTAQHSPEEVVAMLQSARVPAGVVQNAEDLFQDPHLAARNVFRRVSHPRLGETASDASPIRMSGERGRTWMPAPLLGEHNRYVFLDLLRLSELEWSEYVQSGVIG